MSNNIPQYNNKENMASNQAESSEPVNLNSASQEEFQQFLDSFDYVFSDCDGVIWVKAPLAGSGEFFELMKRLGKSVQYVSNNSPRTMESYKEQFDACGIEDGIDHLTLPSAAIASYLKSINFTKHAYCVACSETVRVLEVNGIRCKYGPDECYDTYHDYVKYLEEDPEIGAVVFDSDFKVNLAKLYKAITYLGQPDVVLITGASDRYVPFKPGCKAIGTGVFTDLVVEETKRTPVRLGKPSSLFGKFAMKMANVTKPDRVLFIGDMIEQDIALGRATGFRTLLVQTTWNTEDMMASSIRPDYYASGLGSLVPRLLSYLIYNAKLKPSVAEN